MLQRLDVFSVDAQDDASAEAPLTGELSANLLDRAMVGWKRFLSTLKEAADE
ncbi:hypothetical protein ACGFZK_35695 [Streptomyces sp. NPDC048257]|uniref:hypothetical protein n=1 Tax=Streptomyces sp. NPDC048257 TaxID=3365526 RepID=UPI00371CC061